MRRHRLLALVVTLVATRGASAAAQIRVEQFAACDGKTDATAGIAKMLASGHGGTLLVPSGCRLLIASPGVGGAAVTVPSDTTIRCEDQTAGFFLARRSCEGGRYPGAACTADADCLGGGKCGVDGGGEPFARADENASFTLLVAAPGSTRVALENCRLWANGADPYGRCRGGTNDGRPCLHVCDGNPEIGCDAHQDCVDQKAGTRCSNLDDCKTAPAPGTCDAAAGAPVGAGRVTLVDFSAASQAVIQSVIASDHRRGDLSFAVGDGYDARIRDCDNTVQIRPAWPRSFLAPAVPPPAWSVATGARLGGETGGRLSSSKIRGLTIGVRAGGSYQSVTDSDIEVVGAGPGTYAIDTEGNGNRIIGNRIRAGGANAFGIYLDRLQQIVAMNQVVAWGCVRNGPMHSSGNITFAENRCFGGEGPKILAMGAGWTIVNNYLAWGTKQGGILELGSSERRATGTAHLIATGNFLHSEFPGVAAVKLVDVGKRCASGTKADERCTTDDCAPETGCPGATGCPDTCAPPGCCKPTVHEDVNITGNTFLAADVAVDAALTGGGTTIDSLTVTSNVGSAFLKSGVALPADPRLVANVLIATNNFRPSTTPVVNWQPTMGTTASNAFATPAHDGLEVVPLTNASGAAFAAGDVLAVATTADNAVTRAAPHARKAIGIALTGAADGAVERVAVRGTTSCNTGDVDVARGDRLRVGDTAGRLVPGASRNRSVAVALSARRRGDAAQSVRCLLLP